MLEHWINLLHKRRQWDSWDLEKECPQELILEILEEQNTFSPKKLNVAYFEMHLISGFGDDVFESRKQLAEYNQLTEDLHNEVAKNNQTLAHHLIVFSLLDDLSNGSQSVGLMQIGLASAHIALGATARGLDSGFVRCLNAQRRDLENSLQEKFGRIQLILGVGYGTMNDYTDPITGETATPSSRLFPESTRNPIPSLSSYLTIHGK